MSQTRKFISRDVNLTKLLLGDTRGYRFIDGWLGREKGTVGGENGRWTSRTKLEKKIDYSAIRALVAQLTSRTEKICNVTYETIFREFRVGKL